MINKIRRTRSKSSICQLRVSLPERIGRLEVLLPINQNILERDWTFILKTTVKSAKCETTIVPLTVPLNCPITSMTRTLSFSAQIGLVITNHVREFCYGFDYICNCNMAVKLKQYVILSIFAVMSM